MIHKIKQRFILLSMVPLLFVLVILVFSMNAVNYSRFLKDTDKTLGTIIHEKTLFGESVNMPTSDAEETPLDMIYEILHESRFFTVTLDRNGNLKYANTDRISTVTSLKAIEYAKSAAKRSDNIGFYPGTYFRYMYENVDDTTRVVFLDCRGQLESMGMFFFSSVGVAALGYLLILFVIVMLAGRIIRPFADNYEKQKRFITDAGHEIKTPLTIISANADLMEMEHGENEYIDEIKTQVTNMKNLTQSLVYLAKMEESDNSVTKIKLPISDIAEEVISSFGAPAQVAGVEIISSVKPMLSVKGEERSMRTLVSTLIDNAVKYATHGSKIQVSLKRRGVNVMLTVSNETDEVFDREKLDMLFERFWRNDTSRNSSTGGHGIGLSIARAIAEKHGGRISAQSSGKQLSITAILPING